jgi:hypothetical protein
MTKIIGITGLSGSGKSTIADILVYDFDFVRVKMAGPLKSMLRAIGLGDAEIEGELKNEPCPLLGGMTPRHAMQTLGTEWGRKCIHENLWVDLWSEGACSALELGDAPGVVCDDVRFANEADAVRRLSGEIWGVSRDGVLPGTHSSETELAEIVPDVLISNGGTIEDLQDTVFALMRQ